MTRSSLFVASSAILLSSAGLLGCSPSQSTGPAEAKAQSTPTVMASPALHSSGGESVADVVESVLPSVVSITSTKHVRPRSPMEMFFGGQGAQGRPQQGLGSGVILSADGLIVTNNHVIEGADEIEVRTHDDVEYKAKLVGTDPKSDVAVLQLQGDLGQLKPITVGDSSGLRLGDVVLAVGNPFGVGQTVTMGIVSATGRSELGIVDYENFIQTDAAINPGNSGGALVNMRGELVGINTAILSRSGGSMGIGFAIPTNMAAPIVDQLRTAGKVSRGWLGVSIQEIDGDLRAALGLQHAGGVLIADVMSDGPAQAAGLKSGDVVTAVGDSKVTSPGHFRNLIASSGAHKKLTLKVMRDGKEKTVQVELGAQDKSEESAPNADETQKASPSMDGLGLRELDEELRQRLDVPPTVNGVVVVKIAPGSKAAEAGLRPGDVILQVNRQPVESLEQATKLYKSTQGARLLQVLRRGMRQFVVIK